ncbi:DsbA family protein [Roseobacter sp.]|uniref:DsbA family protein n=1 Tax=Roseobacter sp. TaxID=1907202 RepID=UPI00385CF250
MRRRDALVIGGAGFIALSIPQILRHRRQDMAFSDLTAIPGFRRLERGKISAAPDLFTGLETPEEAAATQRLPLNLCEAVFPQTPLPGRVPIAVFSDYYCPYCAILDKRLADLQSSEMSIDLSFHELPLLGERSRWAASVALAAANQADHTTIHLDMMQRVLRPGLPGVRSLAERHGLDAEKVMADAESEVMAERIEDALALGRGLGIPGTPGLMIGRTLVVGALSEKDLEQLVAMEREDLITECR